MKRFMSVLMGLLVAVFVFNQAEAGLVGYWPLDGNALDYSGNDFDGTVSGTAGSVTGIVGGALDFDGNTFVDAGMHSLLEFTDESFSIEAWVKPESITGYAGIAGGSPGPGSTYYNLAVDPGAIPWFGLYGLIESGGNGERWAYWNPWYDPTHQLPIGSWTHVVGTREPGGVSYSLAELTIGNLYINGVLAVSYPYMPETLSVGNWKFIIGGRGLGNGFDGAIDEVTVYDHTLSAQDVAAHYSDGLAGIPITSPIVAKAGPDKLNVEATSPDGALISLNGSASRGGVSYSWNTTAGTITEDGVNIDNVGTPGAVLSLGVSQTAIVTLTVSDGVSSDTDEMLASVVDTTVPDVEITKPVDGEVSPSAAIQVHVRVKDNTATTVSISMNEQIVALSAPDENGYMTAQTNLIQPKEEIDITAVAIDAVGHEGSDTVTTIKAHDLGKSGK